MTYFETVSPTYIENWPNELYSLSIAQADIPLTLTDARRLGANIAEYGHTFALPIDLSINIAHIRAAVAAAVEKFPRGAFIRLGSRSPKDSWLGEANGFKVLPGEDPLRFILDVSERMSDDLHLCLNAGYTPHIFVREWVDIPRWAEFRCFMRDRKLLGVSQYNYLYGEVFTEIVEKHGTFLWAIENFFKIFRDASHLDTVVFDVFIKIRKYEHTAMYEVKLLEINPFCEYTDPCLYAWNREFHYGIKYNTNVKGD